VNLGSRAPTQRPRERAALPLPIHPSWLPCYRDGTHCQAQRCATRLCRSGGYQGSHPPKTAIKNPATALPARLRAGHQRTTASRPNAGSHQLGDSHTRAEGPCVRVSIPGSRQNGALSVNFRSTAKHRTFTELFPPCSWPIWLTPGTAQRIPPRPFRPTFAQLSYNHLAF
jgi:hypothetical protein